MRLDGTYSVRFMGVRLMTVSITTGAIRSENGRALVDVDYAYKVIKGRTLIYRLMSMFATTLDIELPVTKWMSDMT